MSRFGWAAAAILPAVIALAACGGSDEPVPAGSSDPVAPRSSPSGDATPTVAEAPPAAEGSTATTGNDICALLDDGEVASVLGDGAMVSTSASYGGLTEATGGQCVWTDDAAGDAFGATATNLELVVFVPDGPNPPPAEAPSVGTDTVVTDGTGAYFATDARVLWLRVTGANSSAAGTVEAARALVGPVRRRA